MLRGVERKLLMTSLEEVFSPWMVVPLLAGLLGLVAVAAALVIYRRTGIHMGALEFFTRLVRARGVHIIGPAGLQRMLSAGSDLLLIDLREPDRFTAWHMAGAVGHPFDDFLREVVVEDRYAEWRERVVVLVCDTGHMSRVAGEILAEEEGFTAVYSLRGGTRRWRQWQDAMARSCCAGLVRPARSGDRVES